MYVHSQIFSVSIQYIMYTACEPSSFHAVDLVLPFFRLPQALPSPQNNPSLLRNVLHNTGPRNGPLRLRPNFAHTLSTTHPSTPLNSSAFVRATLISS